MTAWLFIVWIALGYRRMLSYAADHGHDFVNLECAACYGPTHWMSLPASPDTQTQENEG